MDARQRNDLIASTREYLQNVVGTTGRAEELVKMTTQIVQNGKRLTEGVPEHLRTKSTATLAGFVMAAKAIAKDTRAVDSSLLQSLVAAKRSVETLVGELERWHASQSPRQRDEVALTELLQDSSPPSTPLSESELRLAEELRRLHKILRRKREPQMSPKEHGPPEEALKMAVTGIKRSAAELTEAAGQKTASKEALLQPMVLMAKMVCVLMDLVDSLFVSKFPMRTQVHTFCQTLIETVLSYKDQQSKTEEASALRTISTQVPALMNALETMVEQCLERSRELESAQKFSIQRRVDLRDLDKFGPGFSQRTSPAVRRKKEEEKEEEKPLSDEFEVYVTICTSVAVDQREHKPMLKGSEVVLKASRTTHIIDVRRDLSFQTGIPLDHLEIKYRGDDVLPDSALVTPNNPIPYFLFNLYEPSEEEVKEFKKELRKKTRITLETLDWSKVTGPIAVALFDYEALTDESDNLDFDDGDIIEIIERGGDGWWTGRLDEKVGAFPASFVEEVDRPASKEELKRLLKRFRKPLHLRAEKKEAQSHAAQTETITFDEDSTTSTPRAMQVVSSGGGHRRNLKRSSEGDQFSKTSPTKSSARNPRRTSEPVFTQFDQSRGEPKKAKKLSLFKKRTSNHSPLPHERPRSPILDSPTTKKQPGNSLFPDDAQNGTSAEPQPRALVRPASSPKIALKVPKRLLEQREREAVPASLGLTKPIQRPRRPPPPPPPRPYAITHGSVGMSSFLHDRDDIDDGDSDSPNGGSSPAQSPPLEMHGRSVLEEEVEEEEEEEEEVERRREVLVGSPEESNLTTAQSRSMEELLKNIEDFQAVDLLAPPPSGTKGSGGARDYATIPRSELPVKKEPVEEKEEEDDEEEEEEEEELLGFRETELSPPTISVTDDRDDSRSGHSSPSVPPRSRHVKRSAPSPPSERPPLPPSTPPPPSRSSIPSRPAPPSKSSPPSRPSPLSKPPSLSSRPVENGVERGAKRQEAEKEHDHPVAPPRIKKSRTLKKTSVEGISARPSDSHDGAASPRPARSSPTPPPKPAALKSRQKTLLVNAARPSPSSAPASRTTSPDDPSRLGASSLSKEGSASSNVLASASISPVVKHKARNSPSSTSSSSPATSPTKPAKLPVTLLGVCTGIGKEGILYKEGTSTKDWMARYFKLLDNKIVYYEQTSYTEGMNPLGQILVKRMESAVLVGERNGFHLFAINMRYDTSVILGTHTATEMADWVQSINKMIKTAKSGASRKSFGPSYRAALKCITYLSEDRRVASSRSFVVSGGNQARVKRWLEFIDEGKDPDISDMPDTATAVTLLKALFRDSRIGSPLSHDVARELCDLVKSATPIAVLASKMDSLGRELRNLLKQMLKLFGRVLVFSNENNTSVSDLNKVYGPLLFDRVSPGQSEPLLGYLISTCELVLS